MAIHKFTKLIESGQAIPVFGDGKVKRDFTYITDILDGIESAINRINGYQIYNLGESRVIELLELIALIEKNLGKKAAIEWLPPQAGDVKITFADVSKAKNELDYNPKVDIETGIQHFVQWYRENKHLLR